MKMEKYKLVKVVLGIMVCSFIMLFSAKQSLAVENFTDLTNTVPTNSTSNNTSGNQLTSTNNTTSNTTNTANNAVLTTNNTSTRNNATLPDTGLESSMPVMLVLVVFGISAVYAYKKIQDYKNI